MTRHNITPTIRFSDMVQNLNECILPQAIADWQSSSAALRESMDALFETLSDVQ